MKKTFAILLAVMMLVTLFPVVTAEENIDITPADVIPEEIVEGEIPAEDPENEEPAGEEPADEEADDEEAAEEEPAAEEPTAEEPAAEEPVADDDAADEIPAAAEENDDDDSDAEAEVPAEAEEPAAAEEIPAADDAGEEVPATEETVTAEDAAQEETVVAEAAAEEAEAEEDATAEETVTEEVVTEEPAAVEVITVEEPAEIPAVEAVAVEEPVAAEEPAVEPAAEEIPAVEEEAAPAFTGTIGVTLVGSSDVEIGEYVTMHAIVENANMAYSIQWQKRNPAADEKWEDIEDAKDEYYIIIATEAAGQFVYRAFLTAEDGTIVIAPVEIVLNVIIPAAAEEAAEEEIPAEEIPAEPEAEEAVFETEIIRAIEDYNTPLGGGNYQTITLNAEDEEFAEVNVREDADGMSAIFTSLPAGTTLTVVGIEGDWAHVVIGDQEGYIYVDDLADYIEIPEKETEETEDPAANMKVTIFSSRRSIMEPGETITLTSKLEGFEGYEIKYQWECDAGSGFQAVEGGDSDTYTFVLNDETLNWTWQLRVLYR